MQFIRLCARGDLYEFKEFFETSSDRKQESFDLVYAQGWSLICMYNHIELASYYLSKCLPKHFVREYLATACKYGRINMVQMLLGSADINSLIITNAALVATAAVLEYLLPLIPDHFVDSRFLTNACANGDLDIVHVIVAHATNNKAYIDWIVNIGEPLFLACNFRHFHIIEYLVPIYKRMEYTGNITCRILYNLVEKAAKTSIRKMGTEQVKESQESIEYIQIFDYIIDQFGLPPEIMVEKLFQDAYSSRNDGLARHVYQTCFAQNRLSSDSFHFFTLEYAKKCNSIETFEFLKSLTVNINTRFDIVLPNSEHTYFIMVLRNACKDNEPVEYLKKVVQYFSYLTFDGELQYNIFGTALDKSNFCQNGNIESLFFMLDKLLQVEKSMPFVYVQHVVKNLVRTAIMTSQIVIFQKLLDYNYLPEFGINIVDILKWLMKECYESYLSSFDSKLITTEMTTLLISTLIKFRIFNWDLLKNFLINVTRNSTNYNVAHSILETIFDLYKNDVDYSDNMKVVQECFLEACDKGNFDLVVLLCENYNIDIYHHQGIAFFKAAAKGYFEICRYLSYLATLANRSFLIFEKDVDCYIGIQECFESNNVCGLSFLLSYGKYYTPKYFIENVSSESFRSFLYIEMCSKRLVNYRWIYDDVLLDFFGNYQQDLVSGFINNYGKIAISNGFWYDTELLQYLFAKIPASTIYESIALLFNKYRYMDWRDVELWVRNGCSSVKVILNNAIAEGIGHKYLDEILNATLNATIQYYKCNYAILREIIHVCKKYSFKIHRTALLHYDNLIPFANDFAFISFLLFDIPEFYILPETLKLWNTGDDWNNIKEIIFSKNLRLLQLFDKYHRISGNFTTLIYNLFNIEFGKYPIWQRVHEPVLIFLLSRLDNKAELLPKLFSIRLYRCVNLVLPYVPISDLNNIALRYNACFYIASWKLTRKLKIHKLFSGC